MSEPLPKGIYQIGSKLYAVCNQCGAFVRINKPIFGSLHICKGDK